jgi:hypothetical protein
MFFLCGLDTGTVAKYLELRNIVEDERKAEQLRIAGIYFALQFIMSIPCMLSCML